MFPFLKNKKANKPVIVAIHGFGKRRTDQLIPLRQYFEQLGYEVVCPILYNSENSEDCHPKEWLQRAQDSVDAQLKLGKEVILVGFSFGGVIATHLCTIRKIKRLILIAPAFTYVTLNNVTNTVAKKFKSDMPEISNDGYIPLPSHFTSTFRNIVDEHKEDISLVDCPILTFHGMEDEVIPYSSSRKIDRKITHSKHRLLLIHDANHHLLDNEISQKIVLELSLDFIEGKLF